MANEFVLEVYLSHDVIDPAILYFGTPVVLLSTIDSDGVPNIAPMSSVFWLGKTAVLGMGGRSRTARNLLETGRCVLNLPSADQVAAVDRLALTTGNPDLSSTKYDVGYRHEPDKFGRARLTPISALPGYAPRIFECPVHLEGQVASHHVLVTDDSDSPPMYIFQVAIERVHVHPSIRQPGTSHRIDPDRWRPLLMSFQRFYGLGPEIHPSKLATIQEEWYR